MKAIAVVAVSLKIIALGTLEENDLSHNSLANSAFEVLPGDGAGGVVLMIGEALFKEGVDRLIDRDLVLFSFDFSPKFGSQPQFLLRTQALHFGHSLYQHGQTLRHTSGRRKP
jgi:hypothetical protein